MKLTKWTYLKLIMSLCTWLLLAGIALAQSPTSAGTATAPDDWLFRQTGNPWWYKTTASPQPVELQHRAPSAAEASVVLRVKTLMATKPAKAFALIEDNVIVHQQYNAPASDDVLIFGFSMGKTVTAMAVGQAICARKLTYDTKSSALIPQLEGKALGNATVRDLLKMSSGTWEGNSDSTVLSPEQAAAWSRGDLNLMDVVTDERVTKAQRGLFSEYKPGERFAYKSTDPYVLAMLTSKAVAMPWSHWIQQSVLNPMGMSKPGLYAQDRTANGAADGGLRMRMEDWIRFALWVKRSSAEQGCLGDFVREAFKPQIKNGSGPNDRRSGKYFASYGYLTWTDSSFAPNTVWASGWGGQRIGWSTDPGNRRMIVSFSSVENWQDDLYQLANDWMHLK